MGTWAGCDWNGDMGWSTGVGTFWWSICLRVGREMCSMKEFREGWVWVADVWLGKRGCGYVNGLNYGLTNDVADWNESE